MSPGLYSLIFVNLAGFLLCGLDKYRAVHHRWRIPEAVFFTLGLLMGALGIELAMQVFRHKRAKPSFYRVLHFELMINILACLLLLYLYYA